MSAKESRFQFRRRHVAGKPCECCGTRKQVEKIFIHRSDHPDGESGTFTAFTPDDLKVFVEEATAFLGWDIKEVWSSKRMLDKFPGWK